LIDVGLRQVQANWIVPSPCLGSSLEVNETLFPITGSGEFQQNLGLEESEVNPALLHNNDYMGQSTVPIEPSGEDGCFMKPPNRLSSPTMTSAESCSVVEEHPDIEIEQLIKNTVRKE
jgi:hypothetical protein